MRQHGNPQSVKIIIMGALMATVFILLIMRASGIYPVVFGDEYTYSSLSRLLPLSSSYIPGYLYLAVYRITNLCGDGFLECSRVLNSLCFVAAAPFIYLVSRKVCSTKISFLITFLAMLGPINSYTIYYMPESMFFLSFWIYIWFFLNLKNDSSLKSWAALGVLIGVSSLVKPHAMFIIPTIILSVYYFGYHASTSWFRDSSTKALIIVVSLFITKFGISYLLAGNSGLTLFGNFYTSTLTSNGSALQRYLDIAAITPRIALGHLLANCLMFGLPIAAVLFSTTDIKALKSPDNASKISFISLILLLNLIFVVALFSASVAGSNPIETALRLHMRYYDFIIPLLLIAAGSKLETITVEKNKIRSNIIGLFVLFISLYALIHKMAPYTPSMVDSPELRGFTFNNTTFLALSILSVLSLGIWLVSKKLGTQLFLFVCMPASALMSSVYINHEIRQRTTMDEYDKAGIFAKQYIPESELSKLVLVGENQSGALRALFYVDNPRASRAFPIEGKIFTSADMGDDKTWLLTVGNIPLDKNNLSIQQFNGFVLAKKYTPVEVDFSNKSWLGVVEDIQGLAAPEAWGAWSVGNEISIKFTDPLPSKFRLVMEGRAYGPNIGTPSIIQIGEINYPAIFQSEMQTINIDVANSNNARILTIRIPNPTSPKDLGLSVDERKLGIGLKSLKIVEL